MRINPAAITAPRWGTTRAPALCLLALTARALSAIRWGILIAPAPTQLPPPPPLLPFPMLLSRTLPSTTSRFMKWKR
uniref:Putative secreted peptide n=1 Tax=Anopheles braziliensis TaxID=58242 RepID=A0A2M3ZS02_9DIPT